MKVTKACNAGDHEDCQEAACECPCHEVDPARYDGPAVHTESHKEL